MSKINDSLAKLCRETPEKEQKVVITICKESQSVTAAELGLSGAEQIATLPGIYTGTFTGEKLLELSQRSEIEEITPDIEANILTFCS